MTFDDAPTVYLYAKGHSGGDIGAWAYVLNVPETTTHKSACGAKPDESHNAMEIQACIEGLFALKRTCHVKIHSNSMYLKGGIALLADGKQYDTNLFHWQTFLKAAECHIVDCVHIPKNENTGYMRLADSMALNLIPPKFRRGF